MAFLILHLNEPGRQASKVALAIEHIVSVREIADDAGTEIKMSDGTIINVTEPYSVIINDLTQFGVKVATANSTR
ncbi:hypothetical protein [Paracoccus sulfuroxidans]|uniref:Uncharacterized protein n=1 Tax=Paracoccus sulfuroxidans TaxID=384678 RepID=A0A562NQE5_9RHOB|nr:hypothetical protein [Paracoccus sulfuroxidans]TWI34290.1 hypothetical protein IQ24_01805 [Paracoccus sulfuroxidans]